MGIPKLTDSMYNDETVRENINHFWENIAPEIEDYIKEIPTSRLNLKRKDHSEELRRRMYLKTYYENLTGDEFVYEADERDGEEYYDEPVHGEYSGGDTEKSELDEWL